MATVGGSVAGVAGVAGEVPPAAGAAPVAAEEPWPDPKKAWSAVWILALSLTFLQIDKGVIGYLIQPMKEDFQASDAQISLILGVAPVIFYALVGLPMARLVDRYARNVVLSAGVFFIGFFTMMCGLAQTYWQLFFFRMFTGTSETVHGPGSYSMMADYFPPKKLPRAIGVIQVGYTVGLAAAQIAGGALVALALAWPVMHLPFDITVRSWQYVLLIAGAPGLVIAFMIRAIPEPKRRGLTAPADKSLPFSVMFAEIRKRKGIYVPMFLALALTSLELGGILPWRAAFLQREYGWSPARIGLWMGVGTIVFAFAGIVYGTWLAERLGRRYLDANLRAVLINYCCAVVFLVAGPLMPRAELAILFAAIGSGFSTAGSIPQNAALQIITPNAMRGQVTAIFLFMFTVIQGLGAPLLIGIETLLGGEEHLGGAMSILAGVMVPLAAIVLSRALKPYREEMLAREQAAGA